MSSVSLGAGVRYHVKTLDMESTRERSTSKSDESTVFKPELFPDAG